MKSKILLLFLFIAFLNATAAIYLLPQTSKRLPNYQVPPKHPPVCEDIEVSSFTITLISTQKNDKTIEFPKDTVKLRAVFKNVGTQPIRMGACVTRYLIKNKETLRLENEYQDLRTPGSSWELVRTDSFLHGVETKYIAGAWIGINSQADSECSKSNNEKSIVIDEAKLHPLEFQHHL
jgi:hypothetical protein